MLVKDYINNLFDEAEKNEKIDHSSVEEADSILDSIKDLNSLSKTQENIKLINILKPSLIRDIKAIENNIGIIKLKYKESITKAKDKDFKRYEDYRVIKVCFKILLIFITLFTLSLFLPTMFITKDSYSVNYLLIQIIQIYFGIFSTCFGILSIYYLITFKKIKSKYFKMPYTLEFTTELDLIYTTRLKENDEKLDSITKKLNLALNSIK